MCGYFSHPSGLRSDYFYYVYALLDTQGEAWISEQTDASYHLDVVWALFPPSLSCSIVGKNPGRTSGVTSANRIGFVGTAYDTT